MRSCRWTIITGVCIPCSSHSSRTAILWRILTFLHLLKPLLCFLQHFQNFLHRHKQSALSQRGRKLSDFGISFRFLVDAAGTGCDSNLLIFASNIQRVTHVARRSLFGLGPRGRYVMATNPKHAKDLPVQILLSLLMVYSGE